MTLHLYTAPSQPATRWTDPHSGKRITVMWPGNRLLRCRCCGKNRPAKNCVVQAYYDYVAIQCSPGKGCRDPKVIVAKQRREFRNRSAAQKKRLAAR